MWSEFKYVLVVLSIPVYYLDFDVSSYNCSNGCIKFTNIGL